MNVEILKGQEAMAEVDQESVLRNWNTSWNGRGTLWNSTAAPGTIVLEFATGVSRVWGMSHDVCGACRQWRSGGGVYHSRGRPFYGGGCV